jgi:predicted RNA-binding Zn-ribbon protein involved in translation (DUF1610 family)
MATSKLDARVANNCTSCGSGIDPAPRKATIGEPLGQCPSCGRIVLRQGVHEWGLVRAVEKAGFVANHLIIALAVGLGAPAVGWAVARGVDRPWGAWDAMLCAAAGLALGALWQGLRLSRTIRRSQSRMSDPMYVAKLIEHQLAAKH